MTTKSRKYLVFLCLECRRDRELYFCGYFTISSPKIRDFKSSCACGRMPRYNHSTAKVVLKRKADQRNHKFIDFVGGEFKNLMTTKIIIECPLHGEWNTCTAANYLKDRGCPDCANLRRGDSKITLNKKQRVEEVELKRGFKVVSQITEKSLNKDRIDVKCGDCGNIFNLTIKNFFKGRGCSYCAGKNQKLLYLNRIYSPDGQSTDLLKIGITNNINNRLVSQNNKNKCRMIHMRTWRFSNSKDCKDCETYIKQRLIKGRKFIDKVNMPDGHSEVIDSTYYLDILDIVWDFGGKEFIECPVLDKLVEKYMGKNFM